MGASVLFWWLKKGKDEDKAEEQWKTIWVVVLIVIILVLLSGLAATVALFISNHGRVSVMRYFFIPTIIWILTALKTQNRASPAAKCFSV